MQILLSRLTDVEVADLEEKCVQESAMCLGEHPGTRGATIVIYGEPATALE